MSQIGLGRLLDKVAIVTGGASGIGEGISSVFAREGATVIIVDIQDDKGEAVAKLLREDQLKAHYFHASLANVSEVKAAVEYAENEFGRLDVLVNNAGLESPKQEIETSEEEFDRIMNVNVKGVYFATKYAVLLMKKNGGGSIINISSGYGIKAAPLGGFATYSASKGAVRMLTKSTAVSHARDGVRANCIFPGAISTPSLQEAIDLAPDPAAAEEFYHQAQPIGHVGHPNDIAYGALYLASDESKFCIGTELAIDGGLLAQ
jgi:cyclopentanol dehydrogenase